MSCCVLFFAFYIILCHVLSINIILFIMIRRKRTFRKETKKHQFQLVQKFPHKSILKGSSFFPAGVNRGGHVAAVTFGLQLLWATSHLLGKPTIYKDRWECLCLSLSFNMVCWNFTQTKKLSRNRIITRFADPTACESKAPSWEDTLGPNSIPKVYSSKVPWIHWDI